MFARLIVLNAIKKQHKIAIWNFDSHKLCLSLNGSTEKINNLTRQGYDVAIKAMSKLSALKKNYGVNWVA